MGDVSFVGGSVARLRGDMLGWVGVVGRCDGSAFVFR
jgi:hypothetical protein